MNFNIEVWLTLLTAFGQSDSHSRVTIGDMFLLFFIHVQNYKTLLIHKEKTIRCRHTYFVVFACIDFKNTHLVY